MEDTIYPPGTVRKASETTRGAVKEQAQTLGSEARELGRLGKEAAREELQQVRERGEEAVDAALAQAKDFEHTVSRVVREQPLRSIAYAAGAGLLLGFVLRR